MTLDDLIDQVEERFLKMSILRRPKRKGTSLGTRHVDLAIQDLGALNVRSASLRYVTPAAKALAEQCREKGWTTFAPFTGRTFFDGCGLTYYRVQVVGWRNAA